MTPHVTVDFLSANGKVLASSGHPCMVHFKSDKILLVGTLRKGVPLLAGYSSESQTIKVRMTGFVEGIEPSTCLKVTLKHRAECRPGEAIPEIYSASILSLNFRCLKGSCGAGEGRYLFGLLQDFLSWNYGNLHISLKMIPIGQIVRNFRIA
ncbi:Seipin-3 [Nymphaea thermarum]|nr:Seipin-3 [Nymphaea thermarum]